MRLILRNAGMDFGLKFLSGFSPWRPKCRALIVSAHKRAIDGLPGFRQICGNNCDVDNTGVPIPFNHRNLRNMPTTLPSHETFCPYRTRATRRAVSRTDSTVL